MLERWRDKCAESSSPVLQILYIVLLAVGFYCYSMDIFCFLPQPYAPAWHMCEPSSHFSTLPSDVGTSDNNNDLWYSALLFF